jgi:multiple sugar transport system ATP-binding protein
MNATEIKVENLTKEFFSIFRGRIVALEDLNFKIEGGEFFVVLGPSGCGKSTLLNLLVGLERPTRGRIWFNNKLVCSQPERIFLNPKERKVSMVFQSYALYPHLRVYDNIAFPLRMEKLSGDCIDERVKKAAEMLEIISLLYARPKELSGGQRQRVAIARALVREPQVFLLDEPLSNLDAQLRARTRVQIKELQRKLKITTVYVTHDQIEAMTLADRIAVLKEGRIQQIGTPFQVYHTPLNTFIASFLGSPPMNLLDAKILQEEAKFFIEVDGFKLELPQHKIASMKDIKDKDFVLGIRAEDIRLLPPKSLEGLPGVIKNIEPLGEGGILHLKIRKQMIAVKLTEYQEHKEGEVFNLVINFDKIHIFNKEGKRVS